MFFLVILALTSLAIAGAAGYFSVYGLAQIFSGAFWSVVVMASTLEAGKLVAASYVYRYWTKISVLMKTYLISAILTLMLITSAGVFGFLTSSHMSGMSSLTEVDTKITLLEQQKTEADQLKQERLDRRKQIDAEIANLPNNFVSGRQRLSKQYAAERTRIEQDIEKYTADVNAKTKEIADLKLSQLKEQSHVGPIIYVAKALNRGVDDAIIWMTYLIMFAFDPLAVVLTIGLNIAIRQHRLEKDAKLEEPKTVDVPERVASIDDFEVVVDEPNPEVTSVDQLSMWSEPQSSEPEEDGWLNDDDRFYEPASEQTEPVVTEPTVTEEDGWLNDDDRFYEPVVTEPTVTEVPQSTQTEDVGSPDIPFELPPEMDSPTSKRRGLNSTFRKRGQRFS